MRRTLSSEYTTRRLTIFIRPCSTLTTAISASVGVLNQPKFAVYTGLLNFNLTDLIYQTPTIGGGKIVDPPLRSNKYMSIGYGGLGIQHLVVGIRAHGIEVGSLKVFLSTEHIDFAGIAQESPFRNSRGTKQHIPCPRTWLQSNSIPFVARAPVHNRTCGMDPTTPPHNGQVVSSFCGFQ